MLINLIAYFRINNKIYLFCLRKFFIDIWNIIALDSELIPKYMFYIIVVYYYTSKETNKFQPKSTNLFTYSIFKLLVSI
jgi:hypothetical protein